MNSARIAVSLLVTSLLGACVAPTNPYDPDADPALQAPARLSGRVLLEDPNVDVSVLDAEAAALVLRLVDEGGEEQAKLAGTDLDVEAGAVSFVFASVVPGAYRLLVEEVGTRFTGPAAPVLSLSPGGHLEIGDLRYVAPLLPEGEGPGSVKGEALAQDGASVPRTVELFRLEEGGAVSVRQLTADAAGRFAFTGLSSGRYAVVASAEGFAPAYALDLEVGEQPGASLEVRLEAQSALTLQPISAVLRLVDDVPLVEGVRYTSADAVSVELLAFGGVSPVTGMRVSTDPSFSDGAGGELPFDDHAALATVPLPDVEGAIDIHAQFETRSEGGFRFVSPLFSTRVVRDTSPPELLATEVGGATLGLDGRTYLTAAAVAPALEIDASDAVSAVAGLAVVESETPPSADALVFDDVTAAPGLVRVVSPLALSGSDGTRTVWAVLRDRARNVSAPFPVEITVDTTPPTIDAVRVAAGAEFVLSPFVSVEVDSADTDIAEVALARAGSEPIAFEPYDGAPLPFALEPGDGSRGVVARLRDFAGNESGDVSDEVRVDAGAAVLAPSLVASRDVPVQLVARAAVEARAVLGGNGEDGLALLADAPWHTTLSSTLTATDDGAWRVYAQVRDAAGTESGLLVADVVVDTLPPAFGATGVVVDQGTAATRFVSVTVRVDAEAPEEVEAMAVATDGIVDSEAFQPFSPQVTAVLPPGDCEEGLAIPDDCKSVCVVLRDEAGNTSVPACDGIRLDTTPPTTPTITPLFGTVRADTVELVVVAPATDFENAPVASYEITSPAGDFFEVQGTGPFPFRLLPNRENELCVRGKDAAGNVGIEDCAVIEEASSRIQVGNGIDNTGSDLFGDFIAFSGKGGIWLHDIRQGPPASQNDFTRLEQLAPRLHGEGFLYGVGHQIRIAGGPRSLVVLHGPIGDRFNVVLKRLDGSAFPDGMHTVEGQIAGSAFDTDGRSIVFFAPEQNEPGGALYLYDLGLEGTNLDVTAPIAPTAALRISRPGGMELCSGTTPRVARNVVIWCEQAGELRSLWRATINLGNPTVPGDGTATHDPVPLSTRLADASYGEEGSTLQPLLSERFIAFVEEDDVGNRLVFLTGGIDAPIPQLQRAQTALPMQTRNCSEVDIDQLADLSGGRLAFLRVRDNDLQLTDVVLYDFDAILPIKAQCLTNDLAPQDVVAVDGTRVTYKDTANNESIVLVELSRTRWLSATPELAFEPVTSGVRGAIAWLETRPVQCVVDADCRLPDDDEARDATCINGACTGQRRSVTLLARDRDGLALGHDVILSQDVVFFGPSEADPTYAAGGDRVAWLQGDGLFAAPPYTLRAASVHIPAVALDVSDSAARALAFEPEGERLLFVEHQEGDDPGRGQLRIADLSGGTPTVQVVDATVASVPHVDLERTESDAWLAVWQRGGDVDRRDSGGELFVASAGIGPTEVPIQTRNATVVDPSTASDRVRGPKVARVGSDFFVAYFLVPPPEAPSTLEPHVCRLVLNNGVRCIDDEVLTLRPTSVRDISISRDGLVAFVSDEEDIDEVVLYDVRARRRVFATPVIPAEGDRAAPDIAEGHLVWSDVSLGTSDVFEMILRP